MAGRNETPRQRMIGMMYLVLTALLALQVSSALIYKFQYLNDNIETSRKELEKRNLEKIQEIREAVIKRGNKQNEKDMVVNAENISVKTREILEYTSSLKKELIERTGGYDTDGSLKGAKDETEVETIMIGSNKQGKGYELQEKLNNYIDFINQKTGKTYPPLALNADQDPLLQNNKEQRNKDFSELNFGQTPMVAALAVISELESRVTGIESSLLTDIYEKIGLEDFKFDKLQPMVRSTTKFVPAGTKYEADLFITATSSALKPEMYLNEETIVVDENGLGKVSFTAQGNNYNENGIAKKTWTGKIKMKTPSGSDTVYTVTEEYNVIKPVIQVQTGTVKALYRNCGNKLNIQVPALAASYNPVFKAEGAVIHKADNKGNIIVEPTGTSVKIHVSNNGYYIGEEAYKVQLIPLPQIEIKVNNQKIDPYKGISPRLLRKLNVKVLSDNSFKEALPEEAIYYCTEWTATLIRGKRGIKTKTFTSEFVDISDFGQESKPGDLLLIEIKQVKRKTFRNQMEIVKMPDKLELIPITAEN